MSGEVPDPQSELLRVPSSPGAPVSLRVKRRGTSLYLAGWQAGAFGSQPLSSDLGFSPDLWQVVLSLLGLPQPGVQPVSENNPCGLLLFHSQPYGRHNTARRVPNHVRPPHTSLPPAPASVPSCWETSSKSLLPPDLSLFIRG